MRKYPDMKKACEGKEGDRGSKESEWKNFKRSLSCVNQRESLAIKENGWNKLNYVSSAKQGKDGGF